MDIFRSFTLLAMTRKRSPKKTMLMLILAFALGLGLFGYGFYVEKKQAAQDKQKQIQYSKEKLAEIFPLLDTLHHQRVQFVIDEYPDLKSKQQLQKKLMGQMDMNISTVEDLKKILAKPLELEVPDFDLSQFPKDEQWNQYLIIATSLMNASSQK